MRIVTLTTVPSLSCSFRLGRQEDAHEYLVSLLDAMHEAILADIHPKPPRELAQTSFIYRIFSGTCRSQVRMLCMTPMIASLCGDIVSW